MNTGRRSAGNGSSRAEACEGMAGELVSVKAEDRYTEPEKTMTESDLLGLMEKFGIGTDASMATHIKNIIGGAPERPPALCRGAPL